MLGIVYINRIIPHIHHTLKYVIRNNVYKLVVRSLQNGIAVGVWKIRTIKYDEFVILSVSGFQVLMSRFTVIWVGYDSFSHKQTSS